MAKNINQLSQHEVVITLTSGTADLSVNSMYAIPFDLLEFLSEIMRTSDTCPTFEKNSSKSLGLIFLASCIQNTVL